jgi:hypothetical protein
MTRREARRGISAMYAELFESLENDWEPLQARGRGRLAGGRCGGQPSGPGGPPRRLRGRGGAAAGAPVAHRHRRRQRRRHPHPRPPPTPTPQNLLYTARPLIDRAATSAMLRALPRAAERWEHYGHEEGLRLAAFVAALADHAQRWAARRGGGRPKGWLARAAPPGRAGPARRRGSPLDPAPPPPPSPLP